MKKNAKAMGFVFLIASLLSGLSSVSPVALAENDVITGYSRLGVNLDSLSDWSPQHMFVDAIKTSRRWGAIVPWDEAAPTDSSGWPTTDAGVVVFTRQAPGLNPYDISGIYKLSFEGKADVVPVACSFLVKNQVTSVNGDKLITTADIEVPSGATQLMMFFKNTNNGVRNVKLIRPGYPADTSQTFTNDFIKALKPFSTIRFMSYLAANYQNTLPVDPWYDTSPVLWSNRMLPSNSSQARSGKKIGGAWEYVTELANLTEKDIWINVPYNADDNYMFSLAEMLKQNIRPDVHIYVELSNEVWNKDYPQYKINNDLAKEDLDPDVGHDAWLEYAKKVWLMSKVFKQVFPNEMNTRIRVVLGVQIDIPNPDHEPRRMLDFIGLKSGVAPSEIIYTLAGAPYIGESLPAESTNVQIVLDSFVKNSDLSVVGRKKIIELARTYNLVGGASSYEGGTHHAGQTDENLAIRISANRDPAMKDIIDRDIQKNWFQIGGGVFMYHALTSPYDRNGCWGLTENIHDLTAPKYQGILQVSNSNSANINFEDLTIGVQPSSAYAHSSGIQFQNYFSANSNPDFLEVRAGANGYASNVLFSKNWSSRIELTRSDVYDTFALESFDYTGSPWGASVDATITGLKADGRIFTSAISTNTKQHQTKAINWTDLKKVIIDYNGGGSDAYGGIDNVRVNYNNMLVTPTNHAPVAQAKLLLVAKDSSRSFTLSATDLDGDPQGFVVVSGPTYGTLTGKAPNLTYTPASDYIGFDSFSFKSNDGLLDSNIATVTIAVLNLNGTSIDFEDMAVGVQPSSVYAHSSGIQFQNYFSANSNPDFLEVRAGANGYASNVLFSKNWSSRIELTRAGIYDEFDLVSFDYTGSPWGATVDATITGLKADGETLTSSIITNTKQHQTKALNWTDLKKVIIDYHGGDTGSYGGVDNFKINFLQ